MAEASTLGEVALVEHFIIQDRLQCVLHDRVEQALGRGDRLLVRQAEAAVFGDNAAQPRMEGARPILRPGPSLPR
jgi:hypothetical protein